MAKQRQDQVAVLVELGGLAHDRHDAVGAGELEERVDVGIRQPLRQQAQPELRLELRPKARLPCGLVRLEMLRLQPIGAQARTPARRWPSRR